MPSVFITHPEVVIDPVVIDPVVIDPVVPIEHWGLSAAGTARARCLAGLMRGRGSTAS
ncbi:hypothetical protein ACVXZ4_13595 [Lacisediminihabitans sp. FW035]